MIEEQDLLFEEQTKAHEAKLRETAERDFSQVHDRGREEVDQGRLVLLDRVADRDGTRVLAQVVPDPLAPPSD